MGRMLGDVGRYGNCAVAAVFFVVGLHLIGIALGPCSCAYMAPVLTLSIRVAAGTRCRATSTGTRSPRA